MQTYKMLGSFRFRLVFSEPSLYTCVNDGGYRSLVDEEEPSLSEDSRR
jgi:hypothetical protein